MMRYDRHYGRYGGFENIVRAAEQSLHAKKFDPLYDLLDSYNMDRCDGCDGCADEVIEECAEQMSLYQFLELPGWVAFKYVTDVFNYSCTHNPEEMAVILAEFKETLSITTDEHDDSLRFILKNASDGGSLNVYFSAELSSILPWDDGVFKDITHITFSGEAWVGEVNKFSGSGQCTTIEHTFTIPFDASMLFVDSLHQWSWTKDITWDRNEDWCTSTEFKFEVNDTPNNGETDVHNT